MYNIPEMTWLPITSTLRRLEMGACHAKASWRSWRASLRRLEMCACHAKASWKLVMYEHVLPKQYGRHCK